MPKTSDAQPANPNTTPAEPVVPSSSGDRAVLGDTTNERMGSERRSSGKKRSVEDMLGQSLECPVCMENIRPPIYQCTNGHVVCGDCKAQIQLCSICRVPLGTTAIRCRPLEKLAYTYDYTCKHSRHGCTFSGILEILGPHEETCPHKPRMRCPLPNACVWQGQASELHRHLQGSHTRHSVIKSLDPAPFTGPSGIHGGHKMCRFKFALERACHPQSYWVSVYSAWDQLFLLLVRASKDELYANISAILDDDHPAAHQYTYSLSATLGVSRDGTAKEGKPNPCCLTFEGKCESVVAWGEEDARDNGRALFMKIPLLETYFVGDDGQNVMLSGALFNKRS